MNLNLHLTELRKIAFVFSFLNLKPIESTCMVGLKLLAEFALDCQTII